MMNRRDEILRRRLRWLSRLPRFGKPSKGARHHLVLFPSWHGSLGDEAMAVALLAELKRRDPDCRTTLLVPSEEDRIALAHLGTPTCAVTSAYRQSRDLRIFKTLLSLTNTATDMIIIGADVMDGKYSDSGSLRRAMLAEFAEARGLNAHIIGFSFPEDASALMRDFFAKASPRISVVCRDPISAERLSAVTGRSIPHTADLAFLLDPSPSDDTAIRPSIKTIETWKTDGIPAIGLNVNAMALNLGGEMNHAEIVSRYSALIRRLHDYTRFGVVFLPHDYRGKMPEDALAREIAASLPETLPWVLPEKPLRAAQAKALVARTDLVLTGRMHLGIGALGSGVPAAMLDYQGKVQGLLQLVGTEGMSFSAEDLLEPETLAERLAGYLSSSEELKRRIRERLPEVKALSRKNLDSIYPPET